MCPTDQTFSSKYAQPTHSSSLHRFVANFRTAIKLYLRSRTEYWKLCHKHQCSISPAILKAICANPYSYFIYLFQWHRTGPPQVIQWRHPTVGAGGPLYGWRGCRAGVPAALTGTLYPRHCCYWRSWRYTYNYVIINYIFIDVDQ